MYKLVVSGPESTGKTELACFLAKRFSCPVIPEYAREYIEKALQSGGGNDPEILEHYGDILLASGETEKAVK